MQQMSIHVVDNAWYSLNFGANGIFAATATNLMHLFKLGILPCYTVIVFVRSMTPTIRSDFDELANQLFGNLTSSEKSRHLRMDFT